MDQETKQEFKNVTQKIDGLQNNFDGLQNNFDGLNQKFDGLQNNFNELTEKIDSLTHIVKESFGDLENRMNRGFEENAREHRIFHQKLEDIELRLDNTAHNFEVRELDKRLIKVERKLGLEA